MYRYKAIIKTDMDLRVRLDAEGRQTAPCPFCKSVFIRPEAMGTIFYMRCQDCSAQGPPISDYNDPVGLNETSWEFALKRCHDKWNGTKWIPSAEEIINVMSEVRKKASEGL